MDLLTFMWVTELPGAGERQNQIALPQPRTSLEHECTFFKTEITALLFLFYHRGSKEELLEYM
jgi:hypothetical protein